MKITTLGKIKELLALAESQGFSDDAEFFENMNGGLSIVKKKDENYYHAAMLTRDHEVKYSP